jgi:photosystem II stability/assembly factor-like uncharacterized protein
VNRITPAAPRRAAARAAIALLFTITLLTQGPAAPAAAGQRGETSPKRRAGAAKEGAARAAKKGAPGRKSAAKRNAARTRPAAEPVQAPGYGQEVESDDADRREDWFRFERAYPSGEIPPDARRRAWESRPGREKGDKALPLSLFAWTPIGPGPTEGFVPQWGVTSGRINAVAVHPTSPNVILVGASTGGIWRSADGGATFAPVSDSQVDLSVGAIAFAPSNPNVVYAGMGDIDNSYVGTGVLKSTDAGATWARVSNTTFPAQGFVTDILVDPANPDRVYAAQDLSHDPTRQTTPSLFFFTSGVRVSEDGGVTWTRTLAGRARSLAIHPASPQIIYAAMRTVDGGAAGVYKSTSGGSAGSWNLIYSSPYPNTSSSAVTRDIQVAVTPAAPENVYVYVGRTVSPGREIRIEVSTDGGASWSARGAGGVANIDTGQFGYNTYIEVSPASASTIYVGARDIFKTTNGDQPTPTWTNITKNFVAPYTCNTCYQPFSSNTHPDQQALAFDPADANTIYAGNDGGVSKSTDAGLSFASLNQTLSLTQFVHLSLHPTDPAVSYGGTQDNGTQRRLEGTSRWREFSAGDGGRSVINPADPSMVFTTYIYGAISRFTANGATFTSRVANTDTFGESDANGAVPRVAFYPPLVGNGVDHRLYFGTWRLFVCTDCHDTARCATRSSSNCANPVAPPTWVSPAPDTDLTKGVTTLGSDVLETIAVARANPNVIYTGSRQGRAMRSTNGGAGWDDITAGLPNRTIKSITVDPSSASTAYLTVSGYGSGHVFKTTDAGSSWTDISANLPDVPANAFLIDPVSPNTFYVGTDIGVFRSTSGGASWESFNAGMPPAVVTAFAAQPGGRVQVATYGRGAYELAAVVSPTVQLGAAGLSVGEGAGRAELTVTRAGDTSAAAAVDYQTADSDAFTVGCADAAGAAGAAYARCDFATAAGTLRFAPGEASKTVSVPVIDDGHVEGPETFQLRLSNPAGAALGAISAATVTILDNDAAGAQNPVVSSAPFFVRQQYLDFLSREPDANGFSAWLNVLNGCGNIFTGPEVASGCDRIFVSGEGFFRSQEFQLKGGYAFRFYRAAFNRLPEYSEIISDMSFVAGQTSQEVFARRAELAARFTQREEFQRLYGGVTNAQYVSALLGRYQLQQVTTNDPAQPEAGVKVTLTNSDLVARLDAGALSRAQVLRAVADSEQAGAAEFDNAFVAMQYYGYLRRKPEPSGYEAWLRVLRSGDTRTMVNGFLNSAEYRLRFGGN